MSRALYAYYIALPDSAGSHVFPTSFVEPLFSLKAATANGGLKGTCDFDIDLGARWVKAYLIFTDSKYAVPNSHEGIPI